MIYRVKFRIDDPELIEVLEKARKADLVKKALKHFISTGQEPGAERPARKTIYPSFEDGQISARIAYNFRRLRQSKGWTQEDVAARAGVNKSGPAIIESGRSAFSRRAQEKWARIFRVDISEFYKSVTDDEPEIKPVAETAEAKPEVEARKDVYDFDRFL